MDFHTLFGIPDLGSCFHTHGGDLGGKYKFEGFPGSSARKESACNVGDLGSIPRLGRSPAEGNGYPLQYSGLENSRLYIVNGVAKSLTQLSNFHFHFQVALVVKNSPANTRDIRYTRSIPRLGRILEEGMATHSSILA